MTRSLALVPVLALALAACGTDDLDSQSADQREVAPKENLDRDILATALDLDVETHEALAIISVAKSSRIGASFEVGDLEILSVQDGVGPLRYELHDGQLDVGIAARKPADISVRYRFHDHAKMEGALESGATFLWPYFCGNLFPCKSDPADGLRFELSLRGVPEDQVAIYPQVIPSDAPSYMVAWAIGDYSEIELGVTAAGTAVSVFYLPGEEGLASEGTSSLRDAFDWLERTYGGYSFGSKVASVSAQWGPGAFGGMEHHPFWHVSHDSMGDRETHVHEAAHGWFGDGVRLGCWEDLALSEGTTSYVTARAIEAVEGADAGAAVWADYEWRLDQVIASEDRVAWPEGCGGIDVLTDLWNEVPYMKGAFFYRAVEDKVGREALDRALARFYRDHVGQAASFPDMLVVIEQETGYDPSAEAEGWLRSLGRP